MVSVAAHVRRLSERWFFGAMAISLAATAFAGFAPTYYLVGFNDSPTPVLSLSISSEMVGGTTLRWGRFHLKQSRGPQLMLGLTGMPWIAESGWTPLGCANCLRLTGRRFAGLAQATLRRMRKVLPSLVPRCAKNLHLDGGSEGKMLRNSMVGVKGFRASLRCLSICA